MYLRDGSEQFVLCHVEVQSSRGKGDLAQRMFEYFYRISDKYKVPVTAIAILADGNRSYHPALYVQEFMGTSLTYRFNSYKILDQDEALLRANSNLLEKAKSQGLEKGIEKGKLEERAKAKAEKLAEKRAIALEFKKMGLPAADIAKGTGLSIEEIDSLV